MLIADRDPPFAEGAVAHHRDAVTRPAEIRDSGLHRARARGGEEEDVGLRAVDILQTAEDACVDLAEIRAAVMDDRLGAGREHLGRHGRRPRSEEIALFHQGS